MLGNETAKETKKKLQEFLFHKILRSAVSWTEWQIVIRKGKGKKFNYLVTSVGQRKTFESSPGAEPNENLIWAHSRNKREKRNGVGELKFIGTE